MTTADSPSPDTPQAIACPSNEKRSGKSHRTVMSPFRIYEPSRFRSCCGQNGSCYAPIKPMLLSNHAFRSSDCYTNTSAAHCPNM